MAPFEDHAPDLHLAQPRGAALGLVETGYRRIILPSEARLRDWIEVQDPE